MSGLNNVACNVNVTKTCYGKYMPWWTRSSTFQNGRRGRQECLHLLSLLAFAQHLPSTFSQYRGFHLIGDHQGLLCRVDIQTARSHFAVNVMKTTLQTNFTMTLISHQMSSYLHILMKPHSSSETHDSNLLSISDAQDKSEIEIVWLLSVQCWHLTSPDSLNPPPRRSALRDTPRDS